MPAPIDDEARREIVFRAALGYTRQEIAEAVGVSRNTVRKYLQLTREVVEDADDPEATLASIVRGEYDWAHPGRERGGFGELPM